MATTKCTLPVFLETIVPIAHLYRSRPQHLQAKPLQRPPQPPQRDHRPQPRVPQPLPTHRARAQSLISVPRWMVNVPEPRANVEGSICLTQNADQPQPLPQTHAGMGFDGERAPIVDITAQPQLPPPQERLVQ